MADSRVPLDEGVEDFDYNEMWSSHTAPGWPWSWDTDWGKGQLDDVPYWNKWLSGWNTDGKWEQ